MLKRRKKHAKKINHQKAVKLVKYVSLAVIAAILILGSSFAVFANDLPDPNQLNSEIAVQSTKIYDRNNILLYEIYDEVKRTLIPYDEIPSHVKWATVALEDKNFYEHHGISFTGITRAFLRNATSQTVQGGSTITQQLVKNALLSRDKTIVRKVKELILTLQIEKGLSKDDILKLYLNEIPYGENAYGIQAAAQTYFNKNATDLTMAEAAYLASLPQRPSYLNPYGPNRNVLDGRQKLTLNNMFEQGYINKEQLEKALAEEVVFDSSHTSIKAPHFVMYIKSLLEERFGEEELREKGFQVITTLDYELQKKAEEAVTAGMEKVNRYGGTSAGLVAISPETGDILAMVGSHDFFDKENQGQVNIAISNRQPGSSFKPYVYAAAFEQGMAPATLLMDVRTTFGGNYSPQNYDGSEHGPVSIRKALAGSLNIPAVKTLALTGVNSAIKLSQRMGISSDLSLDRCGLSLVLGGCEIKLMDHVSAFSVFANNGIKNETKSILEIKDSQGNTIFEQEEKEGKRVLDPQVAYLINDILSDNNARAYVFGSSNNLILPDRPVAAKTGTTQAWKDAWTVGYTPQIATGVWVGNMDGKEMRTGADGSVIAAPIWNSFMKSAHENLPINTFKKPEKIETVIVDSISGLLPTAATPSTKSEVFSSFSIPATEDNVHQLITINSNNGLLATTNTPESLRQTKLFTVFHSEKPEEQNWEEPVIRWSLKNGYQYPPTQKDGSAPLLEAPKETYDITIIEPSNSQAVGDELEIVLVLEDSINPEKISLYLKDEKENTSTIQGVVYLSTKNQKTVYRMIWQPENIKNGLYLLYAAAGNKKSNTISIDINQ